MRSLQPCFRWIGCFLAFVLLINAVPSGATSPEGLSEEEIGRIDAIFAQWDRIDSPGVALGVIRDGALVYSKGYGSADLEHDVPIGSGTVFYMASVSKHFVTFCILLLEEQGKLSLDDEVQKYLPDFPRYDDPLTIRHFIHHTSGVRDNLTLWSLAGNDTHDHIEEDAIYDLIKRQKTLNFKPGERRLYSNACYFMLARIVQNASGVSIRSFAQKHVFGPLGMKNTHFHDDVNHIVKNRAFSYEPSGDGFRNLINRYDLVGSGGMYSTIEDMLLWDRNFSDNRLGKGGASLMEKMLEDGCLNSGESCGYAFGLVNRDYRGLRTVSHGGAFAGYRTYYLRFPDQKYSIVVLANLSSCNSGSLARSVASVVLEDAMDPEETPEPVNVGGAAPETAVNPSADHRKVKPEQVDLGEFVGNYYSEELDASYQLFIDGGTLKSRIRYRHGEPWRLALAGEDRFEANYITFRFDRRGGEVVGFELDAGRVKNLRFTREASTRQ